MKIYFACSITGGREFESTYQDIVHALTEKGFSVLTAHLVESDATTAEADLSPEDVYVRDTAWLRESDVLIAEASATSHGVGYEIGLALELKKPVLVLCHEERKLSKMISGNPDKNLTVKMYSTSEEAIQETLHFLANRE